MRNFSAAAMHGLSFTTTPIELLSNDGEKSILGHGTGFYWKHNGNPYLITNWHVLSGRNPFTGKLNTKGFSPRNIRYFGYTINQEGKIAIFGRKSWTIQFDEGMLSALEKAPEINGKIIDLWALPMLPGMVFDCDPSRQFAPTLTCFINREEGNRIASVVGDDCYMIGYPLQNYSGGMLPIWKRGSLASETNIGVDNRPMFLVDAATTSGMSGSPIIRKATTFAYKNESTGIIHENSVCELIGVYAGRLENAELQATNLGYGWYRTYIPWVIDKYAGSPQFFAPPL